MIKIYVHFGQNNQAVVTQNMLINRLLYLTIRNYTFKHIDNINTLEATKLLWMVKILDMFE